MTDAGDSARKPLGSKPSLFLERQSYRRRRMTDAARLLPFLGAALLVIPLLWPDETVESQAVPLSSAIFYIFACWGLLILVSLFFGLTARRLGRRESPEADAD
ncbi:hypothetical protein HW561_15600 [Rhodobacteraceae bacterium B1Z28]|uniref:Solute:sodium symporter small subunit n=1 Tax=Ruegeria haliotis TaxID=2747601 RepID=A0ABX2PUI7_9RHOB|nr:hypothetical protein [Ruegeria haliotis]NVO57217.1 hypothetical protein [Ruegeria haliotis]